MKLLCRVGIHRPAAVPNVSPLEPVRWFRILTCVDCGLKVAKVPR